MNPTTSAKSDQSWHIQDQKKRVNYNQAGSVDNNATEKNSRMSTSAQNSQREESPTAEVDLGKLTPVGKKPNTQTLSLDLSLKKIFGPCEVTSPRIVIL